MNSFDFSIYDYTDDTAAPVDTKKMPTENKGAFDFSQYDLSDLSTNKTVENGESPWYEDAARTTYQGLSGWLQAKSFPLDIIKLIGVGDALDPEEIERIKMISEREGVPFDEDKYYNAVQTASDYFPTQGNIERVIEEQTGAPLVPKTRFQKAIKFAASAGRLAPKGSTLRPLNVGLPRPVTGAGVSLVKEGLTESGVPEPISDAASFLAIKNLPIGSPSIKGLGTQKSPSGLPVRRFESEKTASKITPRRKEIINEKLENDFRGLSDKILEKSPISKTREGLKKDSAFKSRARESFEKVEELSSEIPGEFSSNDIKKRLASAYQKKQSKGIAKSQYEKDYEKFMREHLKDIPEREVSAQDLVHQYRKNNASLGEIYESGQSKAFNRAKKDSLLDYNRTLAETIDEKYAGSEFSKLFKDTNKKWTEVLDTEYIENFIDETFKDKVNFKQGQKFFDNHTKEVFKRSMGENFGDFEQLMKDLLSKERAYGLLKTAQAKGMDDFVRTGMTYLVNPWLAFGKKSIDLAKPAWQALLDKPRLSIIWDEGIQAAKKGDFAKAQLKFNQLNKEVDLQKLMKQNIKKSNERLSAKKESIQKDQK